MNEIPQILEPKEKVIYEGKPEFAPYLSSVILATLIASIVLGVFAQAFLKSIILTGSIGILVLVIGMIIGNMAYTRTHYAITNKRVVIQSGIIGRDFKSIEYDKMQNVSVDVGLLGVIFKVGTIKIFTGEMESVSTGKYGSSMQAKYDQLQYLTLPYDTLKKLQTKLSIRKESL